MDSNTGVSFRRVDYWARTGVLQTVTRAAGSGTYRRFAHSEVAVASAIAYVKDRIATFGGGLEPIAYVVRRSIAAGGPVELAPGISIDVSKMPVPTPNRLRRVS